MVDDSSPDGTWKVVQEIQETTNNVKLLRRKRKGLASAIEDGIKIASGDIFAWMDCDFSHPPKLLPQLIKMVIDKCDIAIASRFIEGVVRITHR